MNSRLAKILFLDTTPAKKLTTIAASSLTICFCTKLVVAMLLTAFIANAESLHQRFSRLRNSDPAIKEYSQWSDLLSDYKSSLSADSPEGDLTEAAEASFRVAIIKENSGLISQPLISQAQSFLDLLFDDQARLKSESAKLLRADLCLWSGDLSCAQEIYNQIATTGSNSFLARTARLREQTLNSDQTDTFLPDPFSRRLLPVTKYRKRSQKNRVVVVIDPGHGGDDYGALSAGVSEKDIVLNVAERLKVELEKKSDFLVLLSRRDDYFLPLSERANFANQQNPDLFISLHVNSTGRGDLRGLETYYLDATSEKAATRLAERENSGMPAKIDSDDLSFIVSDVLQDGKVQESVVFANTVHAKLVESLRESFSDVLNLGVKRGPFYVLMGVKAPCLLIELFFIDNPADRSLLASDKFRKALASGLAEGIKNFSRNRISHAPKRDSLKVVKKSLQKR